MKRVICLRNAVGYRLFADILLIIVGIFCGGFIVEYAYKRGRINRPNTEYSYYKKKK